MLRFSIARVVTHLGLYVDVREIVFRNVISQSWRLTELFLDGRCSIIITGFFTRCHAGLRGSSPCSVGWCHCHESESSLVYLLAYSLVIGEAGLGATRGRMSPPLVSSGKVTLGSALFRL